MGVVDDLYRQVVEEDPRPRLRTFILIQHEGFLMFIEGIRRRIAQGELGLTASLERTIATYKKRTGIEPLLPAEGAELIRKLSDEFNRRHEANTATIESRQKQKRMDQFWD